MPKTSPSPRYTTPPALVLQTKIVEKYSASGSAVSFDMTPELIQRIGSGKASADELRRYEENAPKVVSQFKADMRATEPKDYTAKDIEIIVAMAATNYEIFRKNDEPYSKFITENGMTRTLEGPPTMVGFSALSRYSTDLSPQQVITQFGLDYGYTDKNGQTSTPYMIKEGGTYRPQPILYTIESPMSEDLRKAKIPFDPRILARIHEIDAGTVAADADIRKMAATVSSPEVCCVIVRNKEMDPATSELLEHFEKKGYKVQKKALDPPYTGNSMPQYGDMSDARTAYVDLVQEMTLLEAAPCAEGTSIHVRAARYRDDATGPVDPHVPAGSTKLKLAEWKDGKWSITATKEQVDEHIHAQVMSHATSETEAALEKRLVPFKKIEEHHEKGAANAPAQRHAPPVTTALVEHGHEAGVNLVAAGTPQWKRRLRKIAQRLPRIRRGQNRIDPQKK